MFDDFVQTKLQNIINLLENNDANLDMIEDTEVDDEEQSSESILQLLENMKSDVMSLDDKDDAEQVTGIALKEDKNEVKHIDRSTSNPILEKTQCFQVLTQQAQLVGGFPKTNDCSRFIQSASKPVQINHNHL